MTRKEAMRFLPQEDTISKVDPARLVSLLIAPPKWGKTRFFTSNPNSILLAFEPGYKFVKCKRIVIDKWDQKRPPYPIKKDSDGDYHMTAMQALAALEATSLYDLVIIDTVDMAVKMCADYFCGLANKEHPEDLGAFGKGWEKAQNAPMRKFILALQKTGRGVGLITHSKIEISKFSTGEQARKEASMPKGVMRFAYGAADIIMHGELGKRRSGNRLRDRIMVCEGSEDVEAGNRTGAMLPERYIVNPEGQWKQFTGFFRNPKLADKAEREFRIAKK